MQSRKTGPVNVVSSSDPMVQPVTDSMRPSDAATDRTSVLRYSEMFGSARTASSTTASQ